MCGRVDQYEMRINGIYRMGDNIVNLKCHCAFAKSYV